MTARVQYYCPYSGDECRHHKKCTAVVTTKPLENDLEVRVPCSVVKEDTKGKEKERVVTIKSAA
jgi:hypothetical protein